MQRGWGLNKLFGGRNSHHGSCLSQRDSGMATLCHWGQNCYISFFCLGEFIFGDSYRQLYSTNFLGESIHVMQGFVLFFPGNHKYFVYSYSFSLGAVWELSAVI